jgi:hypothetical protein
LVAECCRMRRTGEETTRTTVRPIRLAGN